MKSSMLAAMTCVCLVVFAEAASAAVSRHTNRQRTTCGSGTCGQSTVAPRVFRSTQTTRTTTTVRRSR